jgi:regulator of protease activity HflC (stomatin/prohibitin superfamily)
MARACDSDKYRRRRRQEIENRKTRDARLGHLHREAQAKALIIRKEKEEREHRRKLADPRRPYAQRLVNILNYRLQTNPLYKLEMIGSILGMPSLNSMIDGYLSDRTFEFMGVRVKVKNVD